MSTQGLAGMRAPEPFSTPEARAALDYVKAFVRQAPQDLFDGQAASLVGEPQSKIDEGIHAVRRRMAAELAQHPENSQAFVSAVSFVFGEMVRDRIREIELHGKGHA